ncbi:hypothetical protein BC830DRAFT_1140371 [Chytriomyces sp. MP71]|nr:hypothetical protein BC830DRAFT_1140371 [Chytriomyces sp. MP71]
MSMQVTSSNSVVRSSGISGVLSESGYPAARLSSRISKEVTQLLLDMAKRAVDSLTTSRTNTLKCIHESQYDANVLTVSSSYREWCSFCSQ